MVDTFHFFFMLLRFSILNPNLSKCEITGIGVLERGSNGCLGMHFVDLNNYTLKILND